MSCYALFIFYSCKLVRFCLLLFYTVFCLVRVRIFFSPALSCEIPYNVDMLQNCGFIVAITCLLITNFFTEIEILYALTILITFIC